MNIYILTFAAFRSQKLAHNDDYLANIVGLFIKQSETKQYVETKQKQSFNIAISIHFSLKWAEICANVNEHFLGETFLTK